MARSGSDKGYDPTVGDRNRREEKQRALHQQSEYKEKVPASLSDAQIEAKEKKAPVEVEYKWNKRDEVISKDGKVVLFTNPLIELRNRIAKSGEYGGGFAGQAKCAEAVGALDKQIDSIQQTVYLGDPDQTYETIRNQLEKNVVAVLKGLTPKGKHVSSQEDLSYEEELFCIIENSKPVEYRHIAALLSKAMSDNDEFLNYKAVYKKKKTISGLFGSYEHNPTLNVRGKGETRQEVEDILSEAAGCKDGEQCKKTLLSILKDKNKKDKKFDKKIDEIRKKSAKELKNELKVDDGFLLDWKKPRHLQMDPRHQFFVVTYNMLNRMKAEEKTPISVFYEQLQKDLEEIMLGTGKPDPDIRIKVTNVAAVNLLMGGNEDDGFNLAMSSRWLKVPDYVSVREFSDEATATAKKKPTIV